MSRTKRSQFKRLGLSLSFTLPFLFFLLPKGVILPAERSAPSSAGRHSLTSQPERDGPRSHPPAWIREQPTIHLPCAPVLCPSFPPCKHVTSRMWTRVSGTNRRSSSGTPRWLERQRCPGAVLSLRPVRVPCWRLVLCPAV